MSVTGLIQTDANWKLEAPSGSMVLNYNTLLRESPQYSRAFSPGAGNTFVLINNNDITVDGIYLLTIVVDFPSTPWNLSYAAFVPLGFTGLTSITTNLSETFNAMPSYHAQNGVSFQFNFTYNTIGSNYERPGLTLKTINGFSAGTWYIKAYRYV